MSVTENSRLPVGVRYMLLSALGFALMAACVKQVNQMGIPVLEIITARALVSLLISYADVRRKGISPWGTHRFLLVARGLVGAAALMCVYYALTQLPLADATLLQYLHPAFTAVIALLFLNERIHLSTIICVLLSIAGLLIMTQPGSLMQAGDLPTLGVAAAIAGALGSAIAYVLVRRLSQTEESSVIIFYFPLVTLPIATLLPGEPFVMPDPEALVLLILVGIFTQMGQIGLTRAMQTETAGRATAYSYVQVLFSILLGVIFFAEIPSVWTWLGGSLIIIGALINTLWQSSPEG